MPDERKKTVSIMQPYAFPFLGYFHLIEASDVFVFYDDVNFIKGGWINRNRILVNGGPYRFTIPLIDASQNKIIADIKCYKLHEFRARFLKQLTYEYGKAPYFTDGISYVDSVLKVDSPGITDVCIASVSKFYEFMGLKRDFLRSSTNFANTKGLEKSDRLIAITKQLDSTNYVNSMSGTEFYSKSYFHNNGVNLEFVKPVFKEYRQTSSENFIVGLSIIDVIMNNDKNSIRQHLISFELI